MKRIVFALALMLLLGGSTALAQPATPVIDPSTFSIDVTNPYFPLPPGQVRTYEGAETEAETGETHQFHIEETVLTHTAEIMGVQVVVLQVKEWQDGELIEVARDYHAQHDDGSVWYFGEDEDVYENGTVVSHAGAWLAGENGNQPGLFMPADPQPFDTLQQENAPGLAEDISVVVQTDLAVTVKAGDFTGCIWTVDVNPLETASEFKNYCPSFGVVREENADGVTELVSLSNATSATPAS